MAQESPTAKQPPEVGQPQNLGGEDKEEPISLKVLLQAEETAAEKEPQDLTDAKKEKPQETTDAKKEKPQKLADKKEEKPVSNLQDQKADEKPESEVKAEELAAKKKSAAAAQCDDFAMWVKDKCPSCPPIPKMFLYSIPILTALPLLYRRLFCPPKCLRIGKCSKIYPGCCEPQNRCNKPPCCGQR